jgi:hypothetical protein
MAQLNEMDRENATLRTILRALVRDMPMYECNDFNHRKPDQHGAGGICGPYNRFHAAHQQAEAYLNRK